ncbi:hypothetical protein MLD38_023466 [Melastoma candidum]|uniref:Uncharacterized protein n=1 Tax=Melastoma candidum TaxID=119954 RepID=A0ACB9NRZ1_9MYRT|nr:hypothetical protein MLD38_023466 [Melastoma candidum]
MDVSTALFFLTAITAYLIWFTFISRTLKGPRVWPLLGSLPGLVENSERMHDWIADNLRACGGTYQTCICAIPWLARKQGLVTVTCDPKNLEHILKIRFDNYPKGPTWQAVFHELLDPQTCAPGFPENGFASAFDRATEASLQRFILPEVLWRFKKWLQLGMEVSLSRSLVHIDQYLSDIIAARKQELMGQQKDGNPHDDLLSRFMKKKDSYSDSFLQHVALNFILAGRDTSSVALSWFFWLWSDEPLGFEEVDRLVYLKAALSETLRLYPSVPEDSKHVVADDVLPDGTFVPAGSSVTYSIYSAGRLKSTWGDDCLEFRPERICLGKDLAYLQMKSIAAAVLLRHKLSIAQGHRVEQKMSLTLFMKHGLKVNVRERDLLPIMELIRKESAGKWVTNARIDCTSEMDGELNCAIKLNGSEGRDNMVVAVA